MRQLTVFSAAWAISIDFRPPRAHKPAAASKRGLPCAQGFIYALTAMAPGECPEWQRELTVNQPSYDFEGSSPSSPTSLRWLRQLRLGRPAQYFVAKPAKAQCRPSPDSAGRLITCRTFVGLHGWEFEVCSTQGDCDPRRTQNPQIRCEDRSRRGVRHGTLSHRNVSGLGRAQLPCNRSLTEDCALQFGLTVAKVT